MGTLRLIRGIYANLGKRGKLFVWLGVLIAAIAVLEIVKGCSG